MRFAFLVHPLSEESRRLFELDPEGQLTRTWGRDMLGFSRIIHRAVVDFQQSVPTVASNRIRAVDDLTGLVSVRGAHAEGRLYEIPMHAGEIIEDPARAMEHVQEAVEQAADWGARIVGLGSMTGIIGGQGQWLSETATIPVTTGNSLTVYAALENLFHACHVVGIDLAEETVAVIGVPGSIASVAASLLAARAKSLIVVARRPSRRADKIAADCGAELLLDIQAALRRARIVISATSSGNCIDQAWLLPGTIVVDVAIPTDVRGARALRDDVIVLSGGLARIPSTMSLNSRYLWFHQGMIPSCLGETIVLALEDRTECFSLGRNLQPERIEEIGRLALAHGFRFSQLASFGLPLEETELVRFRKARAYRPAANGKRNGSTGRPPQRISRNIGDLAAQAPGRYARYVNPVLLGVGGESEFVKTFVRGEGNYLWDAQGHRYLDLVAGFGSVNLGHNHPTVVEAVAQALRESAPGFAQAGVNPYAAALAEALVTVAPPPLEMVFFANSGTEVVEAALKLSRLSTGRTGLLHCERSFHGKTFGALSVTGNPTYRRPFAPLLADCRSVVYGDAEDLERALRTRQFAAFLVEPIQGEGGMVVPPDGYLREAQRLCRRFGTLLVVDEIQTGLGRTGNLFAVEAEQIEPDIMTLAKSLGGGLMPIGAMLCRRDLWMKAYGTLQTFALHTSTFGGGSLACAAGLATLEVLRSDGLVENASARGRQLVAGLQRLCAKHDTLLEVRGRGLMLGLELQPAPASVVAYWHGAGDPQARYLVPDINDLVENSPLLRMLQALLNEYRIYAQPTRSNPRVLRVQPPLTIAADDVSLLLQAVDESSSVLTFTNHLAAGLISKSILGQHQGNGKYSSASVPKVPDQP